MVLSRKTRMSLFVALIISVVTLVALLFFTMNSETWRSVAGINFLIFAVILVVVLCKWLFAYLRTRLLLAAAGGCLEPFKIFKSVVGGSFLGTITPFRVGGVPCEIYFLYGYGLPAGQATAVVLTGAAISVVLFIAAIPVVLMLCATRLNLSFQLRTVLVAAGVVAFMLLLVFAYSMKEPEKVAQRVHRHTPRFLKEREWFDRFVDRFFRVAGDFSKNLDLILRAKKSLLGGAVLCTVFLLISDLCVTPLIMWGLGFPRLFFQALLAQVVVSILMPFMPVPGQSGMAELTFAGALALFVPRDMLSRVPVGFITLAWRFFLFYLVLVVQGIFFIIVVRDIGRSRQALDIDSIRAELDACENPGAEGELSSDV